MKKEIVALSIFVKIDKREYLCFFHIQDMEFTFPYDFMEKENTKGKLTEKEIKKVFGEMDLIANLDEIKKVATRRFKQNLKKN